MISLPGGWEIILVIVLIIILFKGNKAMSTFRDIGKGVYKAKKEIDDIKDAANIKNITDITINKKDK